MKKYKVECLGYNLVACAKDEDNAHVILRNATAIHGIKGYKPENICEVDYNIPELIKPGTVAIYNAPTSYTVHRVHF